MLTAAEWASSLKPEELPKLKKALLDKDSGVRYWGALGILMRGPDAVAASREDLEAGLSDPSPSVRIVAAQALGQFGTAVDAQKSLDLLLPLADVHKNEYWVCVEALNAIDYFDERARPALDTIHALPERANVVQKLREYVPELLKKIKADLQ